jgi:hypothetical protein
MASWAPSFFRRKSAGVVETFDSLQNPYSPLVGESASEARWRGGIVKKKCMLFLLLITPPQNQRF